MSTLNVDKVDPSTGTALEIGSSGDTITIPSGATIVNSGTATGFGAALTGSTNNQVTTVTAANAIQGETHLTYDGTILGCGALGSGADLGVGLHIKTADSGGSADGAADELVIEGSAHNGITFLTGTTQTSTINFGDSGDNNIGIIEYNHNTDNMHIYGNAALRMTILSTGTVLVNTTSTFDADAQFQIESANAGAECLSVRAHTTGNSVVNFRNGAGDEVGYITANASTTTYSTSSDYRLKENETAITDGIDRIKQLKPYRFNFKADVDKTLDGFFAHEVSSIVPEAISGEKDSTEIRLKTVKKADGDLIGLGIEEADWEQGKLDETYPSDSTWTASEEIIDAQGIDQAKLVPLLTSALQEAITKIETLETKVTALENA